MNLSPRRLCRFVLAVALVALVSAAPALARQATDIVTSRAHEIQTTAGPLAYTARALETVITNQDGEPAARFMSWAYFADDAGEPSQRPITFFFNGGPGSSALWLHLGVAAPKRVPDELATFGPGERIEGVVDNPLTLLTESDLVFVDPVGTGFSEAIGDYDDSDFWGVTPDAASIAQLIVRLLDDLNRPSAPVFLAGESYGAIRAAEMLDVLAERWPDVLVAGVMLISPALDTNVIVGGGNITPYATRLPTYAALAYYHQEDREQPDDLWAYLAEVKTFALGTYTEALEARSLSDDDLEAVLNRLVAYTGIPRKQLASNALKVNRKLFTRTLGSGKRVVMGSLDGRFIKRRGERGRETPSATFNSGLRAHLHDEFGIDTQGNYTTFNGKANGRWRSYDGKTHLFRGEMHVIDSLERAMGRDPDFAVYVACGIYDLVTPFTSAHALLDDSELDQDRLTINDFESGHMVYLHQESFEKLSADLRQFVAQQPAAEALEASTP